MQVGTIVKTADIARICGVTMRHIQNMAKEGTIPQVARDQFDLEQTLTAYIAHLRDSSSGDPDYTAEKTRLTKAQADKAEIEAAKAAREVCSMDMVERNLANLFAEIRANLRNIPDRVVTGIVGQTDERKIKAILLREIDETLVSLAEADVVIEQSHDDDP